MVFWDWHGRIEQHLQRSRIPAIVLRPNFYMSNVLASAGQIRDQGRFFLPADGARVAMIDPRDVAAVAAVALTSDAVGETYVLSGPEVMTFAQVAEQLSAATGRRVEFVAVPDDAARDGMLGGGMPDWLADALISLFGQLRHGAAEATTDTVRALVGRPPVSFAQFARDHAALFEAPSGASAPR